VPPAAGFSVGPGERRLALGAGERAVGHLDLDRDLLAHHVELHVDHRPRWREAQDGLVQINVAHGSRPPLLGQSIVQVGSTTHAISGRARFSFIISLYISTLLYQV